MPSAYPSHLNSCSILALIWMLAVPACTHSEPNSVDPKAVTGTANQVKAGPKDAGAIPPRCTPAWNKLVDQRLGITDSSGHGPDIGSAEWMNAVSRKSGVFDAEGHGPDPGSDEWCRAVDFKVFGRR
jgi:hypothetical protein